MPVLIGILLGILPASVAYATPSGVVNGIATYANLSTSVTFTATITCGGTGAEYTGCLMAKAIIYSVSQLRTIAWVIALLMLVVAGFRLVISQAEEAITTARRSVAGAVAGLFVVYILEPIVDFMYGGFSVNAATIFANSGSMNAGAAIISGELMGIVSWVETLVAIVAVGLMVVEAIVVLASLGSENSSQKMYKAILSTLFGILIISLKMVIASALGFSPTNTPVAASTTPLFSGIFGIVNILLGVVGVLTVGVIVYAGILMVMNFGNEEAITRGKGIIFNAVIGLVLIIVSIAIVSTVILGF